MRSGETIGAGETAGAPSPAAAGRRARNASGAPRAASAIRGRTRKGAGADESRAPPFPPLSIAFNLPARRPSPARDLGDVGLMPQAFLLFAGSGRSHAPRAGLAAGTAQ